jgi:Tfp pilus assembly protein PilF
MCLAFWLGLLLACGSSQQIPEEDQKIFLSDNPYLLNRQKVSSDALMRFNNAHAAMENQQWELAEQELNSLIEEYPQFSGPYLDLAMIYRQTQQTARADEYFARAIATNPDNVMAYNQYAIFLREQGSFQQSEAVYLQALDVWPDYPDGHRNLGVLYDLYLGNKEAALIHYERYQQLTADTDPLVSAWILDLQRQLGTSAGEIN